MEFTRGFKLHHNGQVLDGAQFPDGYVLVVDDPTAGLATGSVSLEHLLESYHGARIEWASAADRGALRDSVAAAARRLGHPVWDAEEMAAAVLSAPADRAAVLRKAANELDYFDDRYDPNCHCGDCYGCIWHRAAMLLRRLADETPAATDEAAPEWARPETEEEKLAKCRRMAKALSAPPLAPPEWATTTEWPNRHKRRRDRRVHATAPFAVGTRRVFWTACEKAVGEGGYPVSHMPVDCRDCKRAIAAAGALQDGAQS